MLKDFRKTAIISGEYNVSYHEMLQHIALFAELSPKELAVRTVIFSENRIGWIYAFYSVWSNRGIAVPIDGSSTVEDLAYVLNDCHPQCIWSSRAKADIVNAALVMADCKPEVRIIDEYENLPAECSPAEFDMDGEDTALIIYTSGTSGSPKGVMLSFDNIQSDVRFLMSEENYYNLTTTTLILLPLHHIFPLMGTLVFTLYAGGQVVICPSLSGPDILQSLERGQVSMLIGVPRLWQSIYEGIKEKIDSHILTRALFSICSIIRSRKLSRIVFKEVHKKLGGKLEYCICGGASLDKEVFCGFRTLGIDIYEGYGMTETSPMVTCPRHGDGLIPGSVGKPLPEIECKLIDDELCVRGPIVMQGYYNRPEETAAVFDAEGFLHTGDLARFDKEGRLYITGHKKDMIILSNGKKIQPEEIEQKLAGYSDFVKEAAVVKAGDVLSSIIVPREQWIDGMADEEIEKELKDKVLVPYNLTVSNHKKLMGVLVCRGKLPRTKLGKLQRFKLDDILKGKASVCNTESVSAEPSFEEYRIIRNYIEEKKKLRVRPTDHIETDLALDSLAKLELQVFIEKTFGISMNADTMVGLKDVAGLSEYVAGCRTRMTVSVMDWHEFLHQPTEGQKLPAATVLYPFLRKCLLFYLRHYNHLKVIGAENIPAVEPFIIVSNHQSIFDAPIITAGFKRSTFINTFLTARESHFTNRLRRVAASYNHIIIIEEKDILNSILKIARVLKDGKNVVLFPEGTRTLTGYTREFKKTFAILSREFDVPIVPACIQGAFEAFPYETRNFNRHNVRVEYLPAIYPDGNSTYESLTAMTKEVIDDKLTINRKITEDDSIETA